MEGIERVYRGSREDLREELERVQGGSKEGLYRV